MKELVFARKNFFVKALNAAFVICLVAGFSFWAQGVNEADAAVQAQITEAERQANRGPFAVDGTFRGSAQGYGGPVVVDVTVDAGWLTTIDAVSFAGEDKAWWDMAVAVIPAMLDEQTTNVDTVSSATFSSSGIINAVKAALLSAQEGGAQ